MPNQFPEAIMVDVGGSNLRPPACKAGQGVFQCEGSGRRSDSGERADQ